MKKILFAFLTSLLCFNSFAQNKQFSMEDATLGLRTNLAVEEIKQLNWIPDQDAFSQLTDHKENPALLKIEVPTFKIDTLIHLSNLNQQIFNFDSLRSFPQFIWMDKAAGYFQLKNDIYKGVVNQGKLKFELWLSFPESAENINFEKKSRQFAYTLENNLFIINSEGEITRITNDNEDSNIVNGQSVHQNEFGIDGGIFFSPKGSLLAFYRMDESMVNDYPIINWSETPAKVKIKKYPMAGTPSHHVTLGVYNPLTKKLIFLNTGFPKEQYLTGVTWSPDEQFIYISILNRDQNHLKLNKYNVGTGEYIKTLFEEFDEKYIQPQHGLYFLPNSKNEFVFWSQRDGFQHLYRYKEDGKLLNQISKGNWLVNEIKGVNTKTKELIITASKESAKSKNIYAIKWENGKMRRLERGEGWHETQVNDKGSYLIDHFQNEKTPKNIDIKGISSKFSKNILTAKNPLESYERPEIQDITLKADDGSDLFGKLILPTSFNINQKYPVIVYLYNGPNVQLVKNTFPASGNLWYEYLAQQGYVVFTMDGRGSSNRGLEFEQITFKNLGQIEMTDQLKGVDYLKSLPFVDAERMGVHGWSYGGFMTTSLMLNYPEVFKAGVAGGPVIDWGMYEIMYTERYMDSPDQNPEGYEKTSLLNKTNNLKGKLLMIHGADDNVVVWQHSMKFLKACVDEGVQLDYFVYPGHKHNVLGKDRVHLMRKITDYFDFYLKK